MKWRKLGLVWGPSGVEPWAMHSALQPTPLLIGDVVRVFVGVRDGAGVSRVTFVDLDAADPTRVIRTMSIPSLDVGPPGSFDSCGVVPTAVAREGDTLRLYYAGYQQPSDVRFMVFGGLAYSQDDGETFRRHSPVPVMDRTRHEMLFRVPHTVMAENGVWRVWYGGGSSFIEGKSKTLPVYDVRYVESVDGVHFPDEGQLCISLAPGEHRVGRPYVLKWRSHYRMFYGFGTEDTVYRLGFADSGDGVGWTRRDDEMNLDPALDGWDSEMVAYPAVLQTESATYLFYNGRGLGHEGFGAATLVAP